MADQAKGNGVNVNRSGEAITAEEFPPIRPGGSLLIAWQIRNKTVLLVGGGVVAAGRLTKILEADAKVKLVAPADNLSPEVRYRVLVEKHPDITFIDGEFADEHLDGVDMVMTAIDENAKSEYICAESRRRMIPVNIADVPPLCDFYFGSEIRDGPLQIVVSTNGKGPKISNQVRRRIQASLQPGVGTAIENVGILRQKLRKVAPGVGGSLGARRMKWMIDVCDSFTIPQLAGMSEADMDRILQGWDGMSVPGGRKGCPFGYKRKETDAGCPWGFKKENGWMGITGDSRIQSVVASLSIGIIIGFGLQKLWSR